MIQLDDYQWLFRKVPAMATSIAEDGVYLDVNDAFLRRLGYERDEMIGRPPLDFVTPVSARRIQEEFRPALRRTGKLENKPISFVTKSGDVVDCLTNALVEHDPRSLAHCDHLDAHGHVSTRNVPMQTRCPESRARQV